MLGESSCLFYATYQSMVDYSIQYRRKGIRWPSHSISSCPSSLSTYVDDDDDGGDDEDADER